MTDPQTPATDDLGETLDWLNDNAANPAYDADTPKTICVGDTVWYNDLSYVVKAIGDTQLLLTFEVFGNEIDFWADANQCSAEKPETAYPELDDDWDDDDYCWYPDFYDDESGY